MADNGPTGQEWGELRSDVTHVLDILARMEKTVIADHDVCVKFVEWRGAHDLALVTAKEAHEKVHIRERGIFAMLITAAGGVGAWFGFN